MLFPNVQTLIIQNIKGVLIDIDNTLYRYEFPHSYALEACYNYWKKLKIDSRDPKSFNAFYRQCRTEVTNLLSPQGACRSRLLAFMKMLEIDNSEDRYSFALELENIYWDKFISTMFIDSDVKDFLCGCRENSIRICAVSDMQTHIQIRKLQKLQALDYISYLVTSEEVGAEKPNPIIFETALKKLGLSADHVIMIGDSEEKDIKGAEALGIKAFKVELE